jgi:hypothetical protein
LRYAVKQLWIGGLGSDQAASPKRIFNLRS